QQQTSVQQMDSRGRVRTLEEVFNHNQGLRMFTLLKEDVRESEFEVPISPSAHQRLAILLLGLVESAASCQHLSEMAPERNVVGRKPYGFAQRPQTVIVRRHGRARVGARKRDWTDLYRIVERETTSKSPFASLPHSFDS